MSPSLAKKDCRAVTADDTGARRDVMAVISNYTTTQSVAVSVNQCLQYLCA